VIGLRIKNHQDYFDFFSYTVRSAMSPKAIVDVFQTGAPIVKVLVIVGLYHVLNHVFHVLTVCFNRLLRGAKNLKKEYGNWGK
jgi:hypothetical protein